MLRPPSENRTRGGIELEQIIPHGSVEVSLKPPAKPSPISSPRVSTRSPRRREPLSESRSPRSLNRETGTRSKRVALSTDSLGARDDLQGSQSPRNSSPRGFSIHDATLWTRTGVTSSLVFVECAFHFYALLLRVDFFLSFFFFSRC